MKSTVAVAAFTVLSSFIGSAFAAPSSYRVYVVPKSPLTTIRNEITYVNSTAYVGNIKFYPTTEPLILTAPSESGSISFLSYHTDRYQSVYVIPEGDAPLGMSPWQGVPPDASTTGFAIGESDSLLTWNGRGDSWWVCPVPSAPLPDTYIVKFAKPGKVMPSGCVSVDIKAYGYGRCDSS